MAGLLDGKSALVTGGGGGIGRAAALAFAREGARVAVADYAAETAAETAAIIKAGGGEAIMLTGDVTRPGTSRRYWTIRLSPMAASIAPLIMPASPVGTSTPPAKKLRTGAKPPSTG